MKEFLQDCITPKGRWNRRRFWVYPIAMSLLLFVPISILSGFVPEVGLVLTMIAYIFLIYVSIASYIKRLRDLDKNPWMVLLAFVPLANIYLIVICGFFKGTQGTNKYGPDPLAPQKESQPEVVL